MGKYATGLLLGVAYSASIGGIATLVGTPPNLSFARIFQIMFPEAPEISFASWFSFALPITIILFIIVWGYLYMIFSPKKTNWINISKDAFRKQYFELGKIKYEEKIILIDFILLAVLWLTRSNINIGSFTIPGWSNIFPTPAYINDGTVAIMMAVLLFVIPTKKRKRKENYELEGCNRYPLAYRFIIWGRFCFGKWI